MEDRGNSRLNARRDDEMKQELQGQLRGGGTTHAEEWREPEPSAEDDPDVGAGPVPPDASARREAADEEFRSDLARHLRRTAFPGHRDDLVNVLREENAPDGLLEAVRRLPGEETFGNVQEVVTALGRRPES
ncbi:hypothetical protein GCM10009716_04270 [Streptomyces sodiiphilus]|uniref:DUF2795 domain-containing protein n=1 Tax=Streptomyces sodiiphilus TaxID=226217 RepID=A0ABP5A244_9ACTN